MTFTIVVKGSEPGYEKGVSARRALILAETEVSRGLLCPELSLYLITPQCRLWRGTDQDLEKLGLEAPYWAFAWAGGQAMARYILDHPEKVRGKKIFDFGAGGAIEGLAALKAGAAQVLAADIDPFALEAAELNAALNQVQIFTSGEDWVGRDLSGYDLVLAGDVAYEPESAQKLNAWFAQLAAKNIEVWVSDPNRGYLNTQSYQPLGVYEAPADVDGDGTYLWTTTIYRVPKSGT